VGPTTTWVKLNNEEIEDKLEYKGCEWLSKCTLKSPKTQNWKDEKMTSKID